MNRDVDNDLSHDVPFFVHDGPSRFGPPKKPKARTRPKAPTPRFNIGDRIRHLGVPQQPVGTIIELYTSNAKVWFRIRTDSGHEFVVANAHAEGV